MIKPEMVPPVAWEAAAKALFSAIIYDIEPDVRANGLTPEELALLATKAIAAALSAWPGVHMGHQCSGCGGDPQIILPLTEKPDGE